MAKPTGKKIKILHIIHTLQVGGAEMVLYNICKGLVTQAPETFEITIACTFGKGPLAEKIEALGIRVVDLGCLNTRFFISIWRIIKLLRRIQPDIVHTHLFPPDRYGQIAAFLCGIRIRISTIHSMEPELTSIERKTIFLLKHLATRLIAVSSSAKTHYVQKLRIDPHKITIIHNASGHSLRPGAAQTLPPPAKPLRIVNFDNIKTPKGQLFLIPAIKELITLEPECHLDIIGDATGEYAEKVKELINEYGLTKYISLLGHTSDPYSLLPNYHLMVSLSLWEGFHMTLVEGMSIGLPIITTPIAAHLELFEGRNEIFVNHEDPIGIAEKIHTVLTDPRLYSSLSAANITRSAAFAPSLMVQKYIDVYTNVFPSDR